MMQFNKYLSNIEKLKQIKEVLDAKNINLSDGDELFIQHMNADIDKFINILKGKIWQELKDINV